MQVYGVRSLTTYLREWFESNSALNDCWVHGEVSNVSRPASGHVYFTLKEGDATVRAVFFARRGGPSSATSRLVQAGELIIAHGRVSLYEQRGDLQLYVDFVQPEGAGALQAEYERLRAALEAEGLFDDARKRPLPRFPRRVGVVTSPSGAVFQDICHVLTRRWPLVELVLAPTPVQGADAVAGVVGGLQQLSARGDIDVIIVARGGGSPEELAAFNSEHVARAIFGSSVPVVSAIGHETDVTIADFVADRRAPTPSAAAEIVAPDRLDISVRLGVAAGTMLSLLRERLSRERESVRHAVQVAERRAPDVTRERQRVDDLARRALSASELAHRGMVVGVGNCVWRLKALDPFATLERGYAIVQRNGGSIVASVGDARAGDAIDVRLRDGSIGAHVDGGAQPARRRLKRAVPPAQAPLFSMPEERA